MSYHFGKNLTRQTECCKWIFDLGVRCGVAGVERGGVGGGNFFENFAILNRTDPT